MPWTTRTSRGRTTQLWRRSLVAGAVLLALLLACERPPVHKDPEDNSPPPPPGSIEPDMELYYNDRYTLGHKWYLHDSGVLSPKDEIYLVEDADASPTAYYKFEVTSYYGAASGESGFFTISHAAWDGAAWGSPAELVLSRSIKGEPPLCVDLASGAETACGGDGWQLMFASTRYLSPGILFPLAFNPSIYLRSTSGQVDRGGVRLAVVEAQSLADVSLDPSTLGRLTEAPPETHDLPDFDHASYALNIPQNGMAIGRTWYAAGGDSTEHVYFMRTLDLMFVQLALRTDAPTDPPGEVTVHYKVGEDEEGVVAFLGAEVLDQTITIPAAYGVAYVDFSEDPIAVELAGDLLDDPPLSSDWDLAFEATQDGVQVLVSPAALIWDWTASADGAGSTEFDDAMPPLL